MAATSIGATAPGLVASVLWAASSQPAALTGHQITSCLAGSLHDAWVRSHVSAGATSCTEPAARCGVVEHHSPHAAQIGGPPPAAVVPNSKEAARAALFMSPLAAMQAATQAAALPSLTFPPPAYVAPRAEGAPARQSRSTAQATAALNRNQVLDTVFDVDPWLVLAISADSAA